MLAAPFSIPPLARSTRTAISQLLLAHPERRELWLLAVDDLQLWRVDTDGRGTLLAAGEAVIPSSIATRYVYGASFYFDTARRTPVWLLKSFTGSDGETGLALAAWEGSSFAPIKQTGGIPVTDEDGFVFDPRRGVLGHFVMPRASAEGGAAVKVRELGEDGVWRAVGPALPDDKVTAVCAGWEARRQLAVLVSRWDSQQATWGWNGATWKQLDAKFPQAPDPEDPNAAPWYPYTMASAPDSGRLLYLHRQRTTRDVPALLWELRPSL